MCNTWLICMEWHFQTSFWHFLTRFKEMQKHAQSQWVLDWRLHFIMSCPLNVAFQWYANPPQINVSCRYHESALSPDTNSTLCTLCKRGCFNKSSGLCFIGGGTAVQVNCHQGNPQILGQNALTAVLHLV